LGHAIKVSSVHLKLELVPLVVVVGRGGAPAGAAAAAVVVELLFPWVGVNGIISRLFLLFFVVRRLLYEFS
jgi:hypothetical protein